MPVRDLHVVTFAVPFPPDYGGAIDVWYRLKALSGEGVRIVLHCFVYGRFYPQDVLETVAGEVHYYPRSVWPALYTKGLPFVISSRKNKLLLKRLAEDRIPVLFEGMQTTGWIDELPGRIRLLRAHNVEHHYYQRLARYASGFRSMIYAREAQSLEDFEKTQAKKFDAVFSISSNDRDWFLSQGAKAVLIPPFHGYTDVSILPGKGEYILYQGDLSIEINQRAVLELMRMLPEDISLPLVIAGKSGDHAFESKISSFSNLRRLADVKAEVMADLIRKAHIILVHSLHAEGAKMKLFPALYQGRFVMANSLSATESVLDKAIHFYSPEQFSFLVRDLCEKDFSAEEISGRKDILAHNPDDISNARQIIRYL